MIQVFAGYDPRQPIAFQVLCHSVWKHASKPVAITRLQLNQLPITRRGLTEFTFSRFLVPYLCDFEGVSVFIDSDFLCRGDVLTLAAHALANPESGVLVAKNPKLRFEWASLMVFNNRLCGKLTPEFVQDEHNPLFDLAWAEQVGDLPSHWNHLVGYDGSNPEAKMVHYTQGIPCWPETKGCEHSKEWMQTAQESMSTVSFKELMGQSVHAKHVYARLKGAVA